MEIEARKTIYIPLNFLRTGDYVHSHGYVNTRIVFGLWWSAVASQNSNSYSIYSYPTGVDYHNNASRGFGFAVRCVVREG